MYKISEMKEKFGENFKELKEKFKILYDKKIPSMNMSHYEFDITKYFDEINEKLHNFKQEIIEKVSLKILEIFLVRFERNGVDWYLQFREE